MKKHVTIPVILVGLALVATPAAGQQTGGQKHQRGRQATRAFVDMNGDGFADNAPDFDGDGIPNGMDPDYVRGMAHNRAIDSDGDGVVDQPRAGRGWGRLNSVQGAQPETGVVARGAKRRLHTSVSPPPHRPGTAKRHGRD
jgi:hypothetical protein